MTRHGSELGLLEYWQVVDLVPARLDRFYSVFNRLLDGQGRVVAQADGFYWDPTRWRTGDVYIMRYQMAVPEAPAPLVLQVGTYDLGTLKTEAVVGSEGVDAVALELGQASE